MRITADDRALAQQLLESVRAGDERALARIIASIHERAVACAVVRAERELSRRR